MRNFVYSKDLEGSCGQYSVANCTGVGSTGAPGAGAPLYFFQLTSILVHLLQALIVSDVQK